MACFGSLVRFAIPWNRYFLNLPEPPADHPKATTGEVNVTIVLRRTDPTPDKAQKAQIGLCVSLENNV